MTQGTKGGDKASLADYLAAEHTLLAWARTGLTLMGLGFVVARFGLFRQQLQALQHATVSQLPGYRFGWHGTGRV